jgi:hypothetical protein
MSLCGVSIVMVLLLVVEILQFEKNNLVQKKFPQGKFPLRFFSGLCLRKPLRKPPRKPLRKAARKPLRFFTKRFTAENSGIFYQRKVKQICVLGAGAN